MCWRSLILSIILIYSSTVHGEANIKKSLNLEECINIALKEHPHIKTASGTVTINRTKIDQTRSNYYPQVSLSAGYNYRTLSEGQSGSGYSGTATARMNIFDFGRTSNQVDIYSYNLESSSYDLEDTKQDIILNVAQAYYSYLLAKRKEEVMNETVKQYEEHLKQTQGFLEVEMRTMFDVTKAKVDLSNAKLSLISSENDLRLAALGLNNAMGINSSKSFDVVDDLAFQRYEFDFDKAIKTAYENRADLKSLNSRMKAAQSSINLAKKEYYPTISGYLSYGVSGADLSIDDALEAGVSVSIDLFNGFSTKYSVEEANANLEILKAQQDSIKQEILYDVQEAYLNLTEAEEQINLAKILIGQADENLNLAKGRYSAGVGSQIDITDAMVSSVNSKLTYMQALYDYKIATITLENAMGLMKLRYSKNTKSGEIQ